MSFTFDEHSAGLVWAREYLAHGRSRGKELPFKHLGLSCYLLRDILCFGQRFQAVAPLASSGRILCLFRESCPYPANEHQLAGVVKDYLDAPVVELETAVPLYPQGAANLWHWTLESLPKLLALESSEYTGSYIIPAYADAESVIMRSLRMFGIDQRRLFLSGPTYRVKLMVLPQRLNGFTLAENMPLTAFLRQRLLEAVGSLEGSKRLYVRRIGKRRILNEDDIMPVLNDFGLEVMVPEDLDPAEQWRRMTNVDCSVMAHGANSPLTLLQKPGSAAVELFGNRYVSYNNLHSVRLLRLRYYPLVEDLEPASYPGERAPVSDFLREGMNADILVDPVHLRIALESLLSER